MMLSDAKLLGKLKEDLAGMAAPLQADAQIFRSNITDASERHEVVIVCVPDYIQNTVL